MRYINSNIWSHLAALPNHRAASQLIVTAVYNCLAHCRDAVKSDVLTLRLFYYFIKIKLKLGLCMERKCKISGFEKIIIKKKEVGRFSCTVCKSNLICRLTYFCINLKYFSACVLRWEISFSDNIFTTFPAWKYDLKKKLENNDRNGSIMEMVKMIVIKL